MDNFLKDNRDYYYQYSVPAVIEAPAQPKRRRKKRFAVAAVCCVLAMVMGVSTGVFGVLLAQRYLVEAPPQIDRGEVPQISENLAGGNAALVSSDRLVLNANSDAMSPAELYEQVKRGVVGIEITHTVASFGRFGGYEETTLAGSGFVFTTDGYVLTNDHVIESAIKVFVIVDDYNNPDETHRYEAAVVGTDRSTDLAVLKIERDEPFKALPIGDSSSLRIGDFICPVGFPLGLQKSMTFGIVSGLNRDWDNGWELSSIQFDAAVNNGNSGGPLFDMYGNVVGIVNKKLIFENYVDNIGLAITIDEAKPIINDLLAYGMVASRPMLGISSLQELNEYTAAMFGFDITEGIYVGGINPKAPAAKSELAVGDVIVEINGNTVATVTDVQTQIKNSKPGDKITVTVVRRNESGNQRRVEIEIELANAADLE